MKSWLERDNIEISSTQYEGKAEILEKLFRNSEIIQAHYSYINENETCWC